MPLPLETNAPTDFDFIIGDWRVEHRRLASRFTGWTEFTGWFSTVKTLGAFGNLGDNILDFPGGRFRAWPWARTAPTPIPGRSGGWTAAIRPRSTCRWSAAFPIT
jgi:hypothetical protein